MILLSGFGPFPGVPSNPTERLLARLAERPPEGVALATRALPTAFGGAARLLEAELKARPPAALVMLGVAGAGPVRLERLARNASREGRPDALGATQGPGPILTDAPAGYGSTLPLGAIHRALEAASVPVGWSDDAGGYVCNDLFFRLRHRIAQDGPAIPCGFLHLPPETGEGEGDGEGRLSLATMERAVAVILGVVARRLAEPVDWPVETAPAGFDDWLGLLELIRRSFAGMSGRIDPPSSMLALTPGSLAEKARAETLLLVRDDAGRPLACAFLEVGAGTARLGKIAVEPILQARGLGRALVDAAALLAAASGCAALELQTRVELTENHRVFAALGFSQVGETSHPGYARTTSLTFRRDLAGQAVAERAGEA